MAEGDTEDDSSKTEDPSAKKLEEARKRGQVAQSRDLTTWIMFLAATILVGTAAPTMFESLSDYLKGFWRMPIHSRPEPAASLLFFKIPFFTPVALH